MLADLI